MYLGIEIGGTKLQIGVGSGDGTLQGLWRGPVDVAAGPEGIRRQIMAAVPELLDRSSVPRSRIAGIGIGFGGPVDDATHTIIKSHQIEGWDNFPLAAWISDLLGVPTVLGNDADVAGLAEALFGAGKGLSPIFYITIGSGIGGGLIINGEIYRGRGRGAAEIGHTTFFNGEGFVTLESVASGWGIAECARELFPEYGKKSLVLKMANGEPQQITADVIAKAARKGDRFAKNRLKDTLDYLAESICNMIALLCPQAIVLGGGVTLMGKRLFLQPLRKLVAERVFKPFAYCYDIVPATLGEEVVVHGALALARKRLTR